MKYYTLVRGYEHKFLKSKEEVKKYIDEDLNKYKEINPTLITKFENVYKTFNDELLKIQTLIYMYKTGYTETFTIYEGEKFNPLGSIQFDLQIQKERKEMQPELENGVKEFKEWLKSKEWGIEWISKRNLIIEFVGYNDNAGDIIRIEGEERDITSSKADKDFIKELYDKFINIKGFMKDILAAF